MTAKKTPAAQAQQEFDIHARGAEYISPAAFRNFANGTIEMFVGVILETVTGHAEERRFGNATIAYDAATIAAITGAIGQIKKALKLSEAVWLPGTEETQTSLPAARNDWRFQSFLAGVVHDAPQSKTTNARRKRGAV